MSSPKNLTREGRSPSANQQLDIEETMPNSARIINSINLQSNQSNNSSSINSISTEIMISSGISSPKQANNLMDGETVPSKVQQPEKQVIEEKIPENKCKVQGHKKEDLTFICTVKNCQQVLMCKRCKKKHNKDHKESIKSLDDWFNKMFGRRVEDSDNNKVSRKCGMNLGKLQDLLKSFKDEIDARKQTIEKQTDQFIEMITSYIKQKQDECLKRLDGHYKAKQQQIEDYQQTYKKLKGLNRFTILENLKRQHNPNSEMPPLIPIHSILRFLLDNEKQYSDSTQIENQHKGFSKLIRDTDSLEQAINNEIKSLTKLASTDEGQPDYMIRDSPVIQRIHDYIDFLFYFEKGIPQKTQQQFFRSGTLNFDEDDYQNQLNSQSMGNSINLNFTNQVQGIQSSRPIPGSVYRNQYNNNNQSGGDTTRRRLTVEEVLKYSRPREQSQSNMLKQIQQQDEGDFILQKQMEQKLNLGMKNCNCCEVEKEEVEYECLVQENFNNAQFIDFKSDSVRVFGDQSVQLFEINEGQFNKKDNLKAQQQIISHDQEMYEIGAIEEVYFFQNPESFSCKVNGKQQQIRGQETVNKIGSEKLIGNDGQKNDSILTDENTSNLIDLNQSTQLSFNPQKKNLPILIIGLKSDPARIEIWDMNKNEKVCQQLQAHDCSITCIQILEIIHNKSILFAVGSYDGIIKTWLLQCTYPDQAIQIGADTTTQEKILPVYTLTQQLIMKCHTDFVTSMILFRVKDDPEKEYLISAGSDKKMILWNWKNEEQSKDSQNPPQAAPQNNTSADQNPPVTKENSVSDASANNPTEVKTEEVKTEEVKKKPPFLKKSIKLISFPKNQITTNSSSSDAASNGQNSVNEKALRKPLKVMENVHSDKINCFEKLDVGFLASGSSDNTIKIWDMDTQTEQKVLQNKYIVNSICRLKKGTLVCSANNVKMGIYLVNIWNWESGQIMGTIKGHTNRITKIQVIPNIFVEATTQSVYNKIITCERNKVIRVWKQCNVDIDIGRPLNSQEDELINSPSSMRSHISRTYSFYGGYNAAEEFFNMYHLEMDPSLTPKINMTRIASQTNIPQGPHDKTPISNLIRGTSFNGQTTPSNSNIYFNQAQNQQLRNSFNPTFSQQNTLVEKQYYQISQQVQQSRQQPIITPPKSNQAFQFNNDEQQQASNNMYTQVPLIQLTTSPLKQRSQSMQQNGPNLQQTQSQMMSNYQQTTTPTNSSFISNPEMGNYPLNANMMNMPLNQNMINVQLNPNIVNSSIVNIPLNQNVVNIPLNQNITNPSSLNQSVISVPLYDYMVNHSIFQQQINNNPDLQQAMEQITIQNSLPENQKEFQQQIQINQCQNVAPTIDFIMAQEQQKMLEQAIQEQLVQRKRNYSEIGNMLAPLEEANESEYNSPVESLSEFKSPYGSMSSFSIDSSKFRNYSRENSNENNEISLYSQSPASKLGQESDKSMIGKPGYNKFGNYGPFSSIAERSPASESSNSSGNNFDQLPSINREYSNNQQDIIISDKYSSSSNYQNDSIVGQSRDPIVKCNSLESPSIKKEPINYQIKLNGVHKYGSLEIAGTLSDLQQSSEAIKDNINIEKQKNDNNDSESKIINLINVDQSQNTNDDVKNQEQQPSNQNNISLIGDRIENQTKNKNKDESQIKQENEKKTLNVQYVQIENPEKQKQDEIQPSKDSSSYNLLPPEDQTASQFSQSAPSSPQQTQNPLLKNKGALSKTKKSSRNIFQN